MLNSKKTTKQTNPKPNQTPPHWPKFYSNIHIGAYPQIFFSSGTASTSLTWHLDGCLEAWGHNPGLSIPATSTTLQLKKPVSWDNSKLMIENVSFWQRTSVFQSNTEHCAYTYWRTWEHCHSVSYRIARAYLWANPWHVTSIAAWRKETAR